jgi:hypothetical protein
MDCCRTADGGGLAPPLGGQSVAKTVHFVRHGHSTSNEALEIWGEPGTGRWSHSCTAAV